MLSEKHEYEEKTWDFSGVGKISFSRIKQERYVSFILCNIVTIQD